jgi:cation diffusion facilitator CzcD-associated flavoprotein CzcO
MVNYDVIVVGAGMSGATIARKLTQQKKKVLVIERNKSFGGVWHTTNWSWLKSDTPALMYTLHNPVGDKFAQEQPYRPLSRANILEMIKYETVGLQINYNEDVIRADYTTESRRWCVTTNKANYYAKWIVNASGVYSKPFMPVKGDNVVHSSEFTDAMLQGKQNVAVIGARESGIQLAVNLPNVTWFSRSFNNAYFPVYSGKTHILANRTIYSRALELFVEGMFRMSIEYKKLGRHL